MATIANLETLTRLLTNTTTTSLTAPNILILENNVYEEITGKILEMIGSGGTSYGDLNYTAFPTEEITMTNSTAEYDLRDWMTTTDQQTLASSTPLTIIAAEVLDGGGIWHTLNRIDENVIRNNYGSALSEYQKTDGLPNEYAIRDNLIVLYPAPDNGVSVTLALGLKLYFLRSGQVFTSTEQGTGTKEPGFPRPWHWLLAYGSAYQYAIANGLRNANQLKARYDEGLKDLLDFIAGRDKEADKVIRPIMRNFR